MTERGAVLQGRYELDQIIGRGGMAEVWRARDRRLVRDVAIKRLRVDLASDPTFQARFRREAQSAAGLNHPNIVAVYDTGEELDPSSDVSVPYIVMELVEGVTLRDVLRDGRKVLPERALEFTKGVLDALAYSHRAGIIHRDIKPANVMLTPSGSVKVMDFGIARAVADTSATMTQTAAVIGTAQYLSPEQARGEKVDNRSDIYAVGCLLYELLVSEPPFKGDSPVSVAYQHVREIPVPPSQLDPEITPEMDAIVLKALEKDTSNRYQDAREMSADVSRALAGEPVHALLPAVGADQPTQVLANPADSPTHVAQRAAVAPVPITAASPEEIIAEEEKKKSRKGLIALAVLAGVVLVAMIVAIAMILNPPEQQPETVAVPNVVGWTEAAATGAIKDAGLEPVVVPVPGTEQNAGEVVEQNPAAQTPLELGSTVTISVSSGPEVLTVPADLVGMTRAEAEQALEAAQFPLENVTFSDADPSNPQQEPIDAEPGTVTVVDPAPGAEVGLDDEVTITLATGRSPVPSLTDRTLEVAKEEAMDAGFTTALTVEEVETNDVQPGLVFEQTPAAGELLDRTGAISVKVAKPVALPAVPRLTGLTEDAARQAAADLGFKTESNPTYANVDQEGLVIAQDPPEGRQADPATTVITIAVGMVPTVPTLTGLTEAEARAAVAEAGFTSDVQVTTEVTDSEPAGTVVDQTPAPGDQLNPDTPISIVVAEEPAATQSPPDGNPSGPPSGEGGPGAILPPGKSKND